MSEKNTKTIIRVPLARTIKVAGLCRFALEDQTVTRVVMVQELTPLGVLWEPNEFSCQPERFEQ